MTEPNGSREALGIVRALRVAIIGGIVVVMVVGLAVVILTIGLSRGPAGHPKRVDALANSMDECVLCHRRNTPGIVLQYGHSTMAAADVGCSDCHEVPPDYPGAIFHANTWVLIQPTPARCQRCHSTEVAEFNQSRHSAPAYAAMRGAQDFLPEQLAIYEAIPEGSYTPDKQVNALYALEGPEIAKFACQRCHNIGRPHSDGSIGECQQCHLRHEFSLEQARRPETCNACHIGPDHPQWEIYQESPHGVAYLTGGHNWHWEAELGTLTVDDFPGPTCAICHISGFGASGTTHDVGERLTWYLFAPVTERRPGWQDNRTRMQNVCRACHSRQFVEEFYTDADAATEKVNRWIAESNEIMAPLQERGLLTSDEFDEPIDFEHFDIWHRWGRTAKFGTWMQGPDFVQWHGAYEMLRHLSILRAMANEKLESASDAGGGE